MALIDIVTLRVPNSQLVDLTNPDGGNGTINNTILAEAVKSAKAEFSDRVGATLDDTTPNESHVALGLRGVMFWLRSLKGLPFEVEDRERQAWYRALYDYAKAAPNGTGGLGWVTPTTDSQLTPTGDSPNGQLVRPRFDNSAFNDVEPNAPGSSGVDPDAGRW